MDGLDYGYPPEGDAMNSDYKEPQGYGAPGYQQPPPPQPQYAGAPYPPPRPMPPRRAAPEKKWMILGVIGIILVIVGMSIAAIGQSAPPPNSMSYTHDETGARDYARDVNAWYNMTTVTIFYGKLISVAGDALFGIMAIGVMLDDGIDDKKKMYLIVGTALLFGLITMAIMVMPNESPYIYLHH